MTETERITNAIYDSYAAMPPEVENLGRLAVPAYRRHTSGAISAIGDDDESA